MLSLLKGKFPTAKRVLPVFFVSAVVFGFLLSACDLDDDDPYEDPFELNPGLIGTWEASGSYTSGGETITWTDTYKVTATTLEHVDSSTETGNIVYVYNFSEAAGCIIILRSDNKYTATYFKDLSEDSVLLGAAYDVSIPYPGNNDPAVTTLAGAKERFKPGNAELYGGGSVQGGAPQSRK
jgi:hypothetical protein